MIFVLVLLSMSCPVMPFEFDYCQSIWICWDSCTRPCGGGVRKRIEMVNCKEVPKNVCLSDFHDKTGRFLLAGQTFESCNQYCLNSGLYAEKGCECQPHYSGYCCQNHDSKIEFSNECAWGAWEEASDCKGSTINGTQSRQREPVCKTGESRDDCLTRCNYTDNENDAWEQATCETEFCYTSATTQTPFATAYTLSTMLWIIIMH